MEQAKVSLKCLKGSDHYDEPIVWVCLEESCRNDLLACNICLYDLHKNHNLVPLKVLIRQLPEQVEPKIQQIKNFASIDQKFFQIQENVEINKVHASNEIETTIQNTIMLQQKARGFYEHFKEELQQQMPSADIITNILASFNESFKNSQTLKKTLQTLLPYSDFINESGKETQFNPKIYCENAEQLIESYKEEFNEATQQINKILSNLELEIKKPIIISSQNAFNNLLFQKLHESDIQYSNNFLQAKRINSSGYKICLLNTEIKTSMKVNFSFKIIDPSSWLAVGIYYKKKAEQNNYDFKFSTMGHGGYLISSNGGTWSHCDSTANNVVKTFTFAANDTIRCEFDGPKKLLTFKSQVQLKDYQLKLEWVESDIIYPAVIFYYQNSNVEIVKSKQ